jgi:PAS domain S-box-containing protein
VQPPLPPTNWQPTLESLFDCWQQFFLSHRRADELHQQLLEVVAQATQASRASLMMLDDEDLVLRIKAAIGLPAAVVAETRVRLGEGIAGWVALHRRPLLLPDDPDLPAHLREAMVLERVTSALCVPLKVENQTLGVLNLARQGDGPPFTMQDLWFAALVADRESVTIQTANLYQELESRERFINRMLESIPSSLIVINRGMRIVSANRNFLEKARRENRTTVGRKIGEVFPPVLLKYIQLEEKVRAVFRTGRPFDGDKLAYRAPGLPSRIYYYRLLPLKSPQGVDNVMLLMDDITEREKLGEEVRRVERHLASVVDCASDLVISLDPLGRIVTWNRAAERASGLSAEQVRGRPLLDFCAADGRETMAAVLARTPQDEAIQHVEVPLITADGQRHVPIAWNCSPMRDDGGGLTAIVAVGRDLTEQKRLEAQLVQSAKMASLGVMAGGIAHEVRNPLSIISTSAQLLLEHPDNPALHAECARRIYAATSRAAVIIEHLLKFSRPSHEQFKTVALNQVLDDTVSLLNHQLHHANVALERQSEDNLPTIQGNPELLQQVFTNLVLNACAAMPNGGTLSISARSGPGPSLEVHVADSGCGIPPEQLGRIFDPFFTTRPVGKGTGLGLSISYSIVQQHGGTIEVASTLNQGSTFTVRLPVGR